MSEPAYPSEEVIALRRFFMIICVSALAVLFTIWVTLMLMRLLICPCAIFQESRESNPPRNPCIVESEFRVLPLRCCHQKDEASHLSSGILRTRMPPQLQSTPST